MDLLTALWLGVATGLAIAIPLGAIGVLLVQEGATRGWPAGAPAAFGPALVDALYCAIAVTAGALVAPLISAAAPWPSVIGGASLIALAAWGLWSMRERPAVRVRASALSRGWQRFALFFGLTAINPATILYFAAVVTGLNSVTASLPTAVIFIVAVGAASLAWQLVLVAAGALLRRTTGDRMRRATQWLGFGVVALLGALMIVFALTAVA